MSDAAAQVSPDTDLPHQEDIADRDLDGEASRVHRALLVLATVATSATAFEVGNTLPYSWVVDVLLPIAFAGGVLLSAAALAVHTERQLRRLDWCLLALGFISIITLLAGNLFVHPGYTSDEAAFQQAAATLLLHGHDPYGANLAASLVKFRVTPEYQTYTLSGGEALTLGYPALPTLLTAIAKLLTFGWETEPVGNVAILLATMVLMFKLLEPRLRPLAVMAIVPMPMLFGMATAAMTEITLAPLLLAVAYRWTRVGQGGRLTRWQIWQAVALGLAVSTQQEAWFAAPFVAIGIFMVRRQELGERDAFRVTARYVGWAALAFLVVNLPFIVWGPKAWLSGVTTPIRQNALPLGQGLVDWTIYLRHGGGMLSAYNYAAGTLLIGLLVLYVIDFKHLARAMFVFPVMPLFLSTRPLCPYFIPMAGAMVVSVATLDRGSLIGLEPLWQPTRAWLRKAARVVCLLPATIFVILALTVPAPLTMKLIGTRTVGGPLGSVWWLRVSVHNGSSNTLTPRFITNKDGTSSAYWHQLTGPKSLAPGETRIYVLAAPDTTALFVANNAVALGAVTSSPATFSSAGRISSHSMITDLEPAEIDQTVPVGQSVTFTVHLRTVAGRLIRRAGVPVTLSQSIFNSWNGAKARASIDGMPEGRSPAVAYTNSQGEATFTVTNAYSMRQPIYFQASIAQSGQVGYGRSAFVSVLWR